ncbi:nucleoside phosphorylase domain-containing protein [Paraphysoderma sedebokerense]|nr:nucleoside phosphorylase domain-containing protein [Paraphysoderma sedebokerense]
MNYRSSNIFIRTSKRGFTTITGRYKGVPVSIVAIGMGPSMMDFFIREIRAVVDGPLVIIRFGTCGSIRKDAVAGDLIVAEESCICRRNYDFELTEEGTNELNVNERAFELMMQEGKGPYHISKPVKADSELTELLKSNLREYVPNTNVCGGLDVTTDSFYCSQARQTTYFVDNNKHLLNYIIKYNPTASFFEMETYLLLYLSKISKNLVIEPALRVVNDSLSSTSAALEEPKNEVVKSIRSTAVAMALNNRFDNSWIGTEQFKQLESNTGKAVLETIIKADLPSHLLHPEKDSVWERHAN